MPIRYSPLYYLPNFLKKILLLLALHRALQSNRGGGRDECESCSEFFVRITNSRKNKDKSEFSNHELWTHFTSYRCHLDIIKYQTKLRQIQPSLILHSEIQLFRIQTHLSLQNDVQNVRYNHKIPVAYSRSSHQSHKLTQTLSWEVYANEKETCHAFYILPWDVKRVALKWSGFHDSMRE